MKKIITTVLASLILFTGTAFAVEPEDIFLNYGGGIEKGDMMATVSVGSPWKMFEAINVGGWGAPSVLGEFEYALPIGPVPFTLGGYFGFDFRGYPQYYGGYYNPSLEYYHDGRWGDTVYTHVFIRTGGKITYHAAIPAVEGLDLHAALNMGMVLDISNVYPNGLYTGFDWGLNIGASYFFSDSIGIKVGLGYPYGSVGAIIKF